MDTNTISAKQDKLIDRNAYDYEQEKIYLLVIKL